MDFSTFNHRFGGCFRTKNIIAPGEMDPEKQARNARPHKLAQHNEGPQEFIRLDPWEAEYLFLMAQRAKQGVVETGRFHGGSTLVMACANGAVPINSIDIEPQDDARLQEVLSAGGVGENVNLIVGDSRATHYPEIGAFDMLFIDGDHSYEGCTDDLNNWYPLLSNGGHVVLHDSYPQQPVMDAILDFCEANTVEVVIPALRSQSHWWHHAGSMCHFVKR